MLTRDLSKCLSPCVPSQAFQPSACAQLTLSQVDEHLAQTQGTRHPPSPNVPQQAHKSKKLLEWKEAQQEILSVLLRAPYLATVGSCAVQHASLHVVLYPGPFVQRVWSS